MKCGILKFGNILKLDAKELAFLLTNDFQQLGCDAIVLTPEILEKAGFEYSEIKREWRKGHIKLMTDTFKFEYFYGGFADIKYLHQLQTAYLPLRQYFLPNQGKSVFSQQLLKYL